MRQRQRLPTYVPSGKNVTILCLSLADFTLWERSVTNHAQDRDVLDRKSTRLNSSHVSISYAVFCLKKKTESRERAGEQEFIKQGKNAGVRGSGDADSVGPMENAMKHTQKKDTSTNRIV